MSLFQRMFGSHSKENISVTEDVMQKLKGTEEMLEKKQEYLDMKYECRERKGEETCENEQETCITSLEKEETCRGTVNKNRWSHNDLGIPARGA